MLIIRLKIILQSKYLYYSLILITSIYVLTNIFLIEKRSLYEIKDTYFVLEVNNIKQSSNGKTIIFKGKEKLISFYNKDFPYKQGDILEIKGTLSVPDKNTSPNSFNYRAYLYNQDIFYILNIESIEVISLNKNFFYKTKNSLVDYIDKYKSSNYLHAFILGNNSYIDSNIKSLYQTIGVSHLFAISGMHVSLLINILSFILDKLRFNKYISFSFMTAFLCVYVFLVNFQVSIIRSVFSYILLSLNKFLKLSIKNEYILILILCLVLFYNPFTIYNLGFQYSYLISFILMKYSAFITGNFFKKTFLVSFLAFIASIPITIMNNYELNLLTIFFNLIYVPLVSIIIFPCAIISLFVPFMDNIFYWLTFLLEKMTIFLKDYCFILGFRKIGFIVLMMYFILIFYGLNGLIKNNYYRLFPLVLLIMIHFNINLFIKESYLIMFDVKQGDSILLYKDNKTILIDTGGSFNSNYIENTIIFMKSNGIKKIDYLVISHGDYDHMGEAINLVNNFKVDKVIFNCGEFSELELGLIKVLDKKKIPYYLCIKELNIDDNKLYFLNNKDYGNENDNSSVIYTEINNYKFLFMGDAGVEVEEDLIKKYNLQDIDVLKVGHHGSKTSSSEEFINEIKPKYSIISVGKNNRYGHPNDSVLDNLSDSKIYRTDQDGSIIFRIKNDNLTIEICTP